MTRASKIASAVNGLFDKLPSENSRRSYEGDWLRYTKWLKRQKLDLTKIRPRHIEAWLCPNSPYF